ncbi:MAG: cupin domain-containing protein [Limnohabitans sp.]|nr:cupin domain-containing protein [Limnohabitans sp.]MDI9311187.1 cupin domain-containing protein [Limnohabitans sp.]
MNEIINITNAKSYKWGKKATAFQIFDSNSLSVKLEILNPSETETLHYHQKVTQVFFVLSGKAKFVIDDVEFVLHEQDSITIYPKQKHLVKNVSNTTLQLIIISNPNTYNDRQNITNF